MLDTSFTVSVLVQQLYQQCESLPPSICIPPTFALVSSLFFSAMSTIEEIKQLTKNVSTLSASLPPTVPKGTTKDKIWTVFHAEEGETAFETFNKRFDALFAEDCRDVGGRLPHIRQGKSGMGLVCTYLKKIDWSEGFPLEIVAIKLRRLVAELMHLMYVL
jgi:hypothetical protein